MILFGIAKTTVSLKVRSLNEIWNFLGYDIAIHDDSSNVLIRVKENYIFLKFKSRYVFSRALKF